MKKTVQQIISFFLPITVLIIIPLSIEHNIKIRNPFVFGIGIALIVVGLSLLFITISKLTRYGDGTLAPWTPTMKLVIQGVYKYVRNPMIIGVLIILIGESTAIQSMNIFIWALIFFVINNIFFVVYEEPNLEKKFGDDYINYKKNVPRWIPRFKPFTSDSIE